MPRSGCSALRGVNPNLKKNKNLKVNIKVRCKIKPTKEWEIATLNLYGGRPKGKYKHWWNTNNGNGER